jgi:uncharacterized protein (TIGR02246 family)
VLHDAAGGFRVMVLLLVCVAITGGCSDSGNSRRPKLDAVAAEPELPAAAARGPRPVRLVPNVTRPAEPFRVGKAAVPPARVAPAGDAMPAMIATSSGSTVRLTSAADEPRQLDATDTAQAPCIAEIRDMFTSYLRAFNRHDAIAAAACWAPAAENVNLDTGEVTKGREAVQAVFTALFDVDPAATIDIDVASIRPLHEDVAVIDGVSRVAYDGGDVIASRFSAVAVRHDDAWQLASVREAGATKAVASPKPLDDLAWLVGSWENVGPGVIAGSRCDWWAGRTYLVRRHSITPDTGSAQAPKPTDTAIPALLPTVGSSPHDVSEIIAWDPEREEIRSWIFGSDGRFAEATWHRDGDAWKIDVEGRGLDTGRTATCTIQRGGADALEIRCEGTGLEGLVPPSCGFSRTGP